MNRNLRIAVADDELEMREYFQTILSNFGHQTVVLASDGCQLVEQCRGCQPDLVLADIRMPGLDGIAAAAEVNKVRPTPVVLVTGYQDTRLLERACGENIMAYLIKPVKAGDLMAAITLATVRFEEQQASRQESATLRQTLEERKIIERAKGAVMRRLSLDESEAFRRLRKQASTQNQKLAEVARLVLEAEGVFQALDKK